MMASRWKDVFSRLGLVLAVALLSLFFLLLGLVLGYGVIGDGDNPWAILSPDKWQELIGKFTGR